MPIIYWNMSRTRLLAASLSSSWSSSQTQFNQATTCANFPALLPESLNPDYLLEHVADSIIGGEFEQQLVELANAIQSGYDLRELPGITTRFTKSRLSTGTCRGLDYWRRV